MTCEYRSISRKEQYRPLERLPAAWRMDQKATIVKTILAMPLPLNNSKERMKSRVDFA